MISAEHVAAIYKARWEIELFFRWIKQHLNIPTLFGTSENAVFGKLYCALIVYVLLKVLFVLGSSTIPKHARLTFIQFSRLLLLQRLPAIWMVKLTLLRNNKRLFLSYHISNI